LNDPVLLQESNDFEAALLNYFVFDDFGDLIPITQPSNPSKRSSK
jgi:hypothetical protein